MTEFNGVTLESIAPVSVDNITVSPIPLNVTARQRPVRYGADFVRVTGGSRTVTITFGLLTNDRTLRQEQLMMIDAWADVGIPHRLCLEDYPGRYLECVCANLPSASIKEWWDAKMRLVFTTYDNPFWTSTVEHSADCGDAITVLGNAPDGPLMRLETTLAAAGDIEFSNGTQTMQFASVPAGDVVIDLNRQTATCNGVSIMNTYQFTSSFILPKNGAQTITGPTGSVVKWGERWL